MSLDTKYRPTTYDDVLGQASTIKILRQFVKLGKGFHQSYLFAGGFGQGKTTLGRILARALLCEAPVEGDPCDQCVSCQSFLSSGTAEGFVEIDAATNSGKDQIKKILEQVEYSTFSGKRRLYLFDESHRLSKEALDALLKPLEENVPDSEDKKMVCIFCTTEPEKMRNTVLSRCAPAFIIQPLSPSVIAKRLEAVCEREGLSFEESCCEVIAEATECHIRDALKAIEGISMLGDITVENVKEYLGLDLHSQYLELVSSLQSAPTHALEIAEDLVKSVPPSSVYDSLSSLCMMVYKYQIGAGKLPPYLSKEHLEKAAELGDVLLEYASTFSRRPGKPTKYTLFCDLAMLSKGIRPEGGGNLLIANPTLSVQSEAEKPDLPPLEEKNQELSGKIEGPTVVDGVYVHPKLVRGDAEIKQVEAAAAADVGVLNTSTFSQMLRTYLSELKETGSGGPKGSNSMGSDRADEAG